MTPARDRLRAWARQARGAEPPTALPTALDFGLPADLPPAAETDAARLELAITAAIGAWGLDDYCRRLVRWFDRHPYTPEDVPFEVLAADLRKALGWAEHN